MLNYVTRRSDYQSQGSVLYQQNNQQIDLYHGILKRYPGFIHEMVQDLLKVDNYSDVEIAFGTKIPLDIIRLLAMAISPSLNFILMSFQNNGKWYVTI